MKELVNLKGVKLIGRQQLKAINGGACPEPKCLDGESAIRRRGICGDTPSILCNCGVAATCSCTGGEIVNGCCYICV